jgi:hypothetical protein
LINIKNVWKRKEISIKLITVLLVMSFVPGATYAETTKAMGTDIIAVVLGKKITTKDNNKLNGLIFGALLEKFAKDNRIEPTEEELDTFILKTDEKQKQYLIKLEKDKKKLAAELKTTTNERERKTKESQFQRMDEILKTFRGLKEETKGREEQLLLMKRKGAREFVRHWKINKALYAKYGGRIIFQQAGAEPLDAYRDFLKEKEKDGAFKILDNKYKAPFWKYFTNDAMHNFYPKGDGAKFINTPWWMMD